MKTESTGKLPCGLYVRVWDAWQGKNVPYTRATRYDPTQTIFVSEEGQYWRMAKNEDVQAVENDLFPTPQGRSHGQANSESSGSSVSEQAFVRVQST